MSNLRVTSLRGRTSGVSPTLPDGAVVTGVTTTTTLAVTGVATAASSVIAGIITANSTGIDAGAGIVTATGVNVTGVVTATTFLGNVTGNVTGNATGLSGTPDVTVNNVTAGVITATTYVGVPEGINILKSMLFV